MTAMFLSSCYWPPVPLETSLSTPWSPNVATFSDALLSMVSDIPPEIMPTEIPIAEHCWCDIASGKFFEPFNITLWEIHSVERLKEEVVRKIREEVEMVGSDAVSSSGFGREDAGERAPSTISKLTSMLETVWPFTRTSQPQTSANASSVYANKAHAGEAGADETASPTSGRLLPRPSFFRKEYDLRPYGFGMVVDFGWSSSAQ